MCNTQWSSYLFLCCKSTILSIRQCSQQQELSHLYTYSIHDIRTYIHGPLPHPPHSPGTSPNASELWSRCNVTDPGYCRSALVMDEVTATMTTDSNVRGIPAESGQVRTLFLTYGVYFTSLHIPIASPTGHHILPH